MRVSSIVFLHQDLPGLRDGFAELGYSTKICPDHAALVQYIQEASVGLCVTSMYRDIKHPFAALAVKRHLNAQGVPLVAWNRDGPSNMGDKRWRIWLLKHFPFMDAYATHTLQGAGKFSEEVIYLPNAAWSRHYHLGERSLASMRSIEGYRHSVTFFGAINPGKYPEMKRRADFLEALGKRLTDLGIDHLFVDASMDYQAQRDFIQSSRINLNFHAGCDTRYQGGYRGQPFSWGLPERCYGIPACGGLLLSDSRGHARDDFLPGQEWQEFSDLEDCIGKIRFLLTNFAFARDIAEAAHRRVIAEHQYVHRAEKLLRFVEYWRHKHGHLRQPKVTQ